MMDISINDESSHETHPSALPEDMSWSVYLKEVFYYLIYTKLNTLLIFIPIAIGLGIDNKYDDAILVTAFLALIPLAAMLGDVTEQLALYTNDTLGGLLNATFGNATEVIISIFAINHGLLRIVQVSLLGSVLSNLLLVLGGAFLVGGIRYKEQKLNLAVTNANTGLLLVAVAPVCLISTLVATNNISNKESELGVSRFISFCMVVAYVCYIVFQLITHSHYFDDEPEQSEPTSIEMVDRPSNSTNNGRHGHNWSTLSDDIHSEVRQPIINEANNNTQNTAEEEEDDEEEERKILGVGGGISILLIITILISILSEFLVGAIEGTAKAWNIPQIFIGTILLPIVGNAAEHAAALQVAYKNKINLSIAVALGSSIQISLFVVPLMVLVSWMAGQPLDLDFHIFESVAEFMAILLVGFLCSDGKANWLKGVILIILYIVVAASYLVHKDDLEI